jgi:hypothetical protein
VLVMRVFLVCTVGCHSVDSAFYPILIRGLRQFYTKSIKLKKAIK